jgi:hypothetical protein
MLKERHQVQAYPRSVPINSFRRALPLGNGLIFGDEFLCGLSEGGLGYEQAGGRLALQAEIPVATSSARLRRSFLVLSRRCLPATVAWQYQ